MTETTTQQQDQEYDVAWSCFEAQRTACSVYTTSHIDETCIVFWVTSDDPARYYPVKYIRGERFFCPCSFFQEQGICAHTGAVNLYVHIPREERKKIPVTSREQAPLYQKPVVSGYSDNPRDHGIRKVLLR